MYRKIMGILRKRRREKGIAVVFVLGILGLLTVIGLGFASTALLDNKISSNNTNVGKARLLARSAYMRAYLLMREGAAASNIVTLDSSRDYDWLWRLNTTMDGIDLFALPANYNPGTNAGENQRLPSWQYVYDNTTSSNRQIIGRFAYVVKEEVGKMDPSVHFGKYLASKNAAVPLKRFGTSESELNYRDAIDAADAVYSNILDELFEDLYKKHDSLGAESFASPARWQDFESMMSEYSGTVNTTVSDNVKNITETLQAGNPETFWIDKDNDKVQTTDEMFHRFNLGRTDWDKEYFDNVNILFGRDKDGKRITSKVNGLEEQCVFNARPSGDKNLYRQDKDRASEEDVGTADSCYDTGGIQWLGLFTDEAFNGTSAETIKLKQIAANIIQYCRKGDSLTVSDLDPSITDWAHADKEPLYAGIGKHPMLNEIGFKAGISGGAAVVNTVGEEHTVQWQYVIQPQFVAELIDMYNIPPDDRKKAEVRFFGEFSMDYYDVGAGGYQNRTVTLSNVKIEIPKEEWTRTATTSLHEGYTRDSWLPGSEVVISGTVKVTTDNPDAAVTDLAKSLAVKNVRVKLSKAYLRYENSAGIMMDRDFAKIDKEFAIKEQASGETKIIGDPKYFACVAAANDPRVNHSSADWTPVSIFRTSSGSDLDPVDTSAGEIFDGDAEIIAATKQIATLGRNNFDPSNSGEVYSGNVKYDHRGFGYNSVRKSKPAADSIDKENAVTDPANGTVSTAYIAQRPMLSLWELGAISRAEPWRTINLKKSVPHPADNMTCGGKDTVLAVGTDDDATIAGEGYLRGDGNILDQVKINRLYLGEEVEKALGGGTEPAYITPELKKFWTERTHSFGKVNINTLHENVLKALFKGITFNNTNLPGTAADNREAYYSFVGRMDINEPGSGYNEAALAGNILRDPASGDENKKTFFRTRADILLENFALDFTNSAASINDAAQEQLIGKTMNLLKAEELDKAYIIAVAQTIKAVEVPSNSPRYFDWNRDGKLDGDDASTVTNDKPIRTKYDSQELSWKNAGYVRYPLARELHGDSTHQKDTRLRGVAFGSKALAKEFTGTKNKDTYVNGVDQITATAKVVVTLERVDGKWKVVRYEYVD